MHPCCQNVSESEWSGTHPHRQGGITPVLQSSLRQEVFPDWIGCIYPYPIKVVAKRRGRRKIKIGVPHGTERRSGRGSGHAADLACRGVGFADRGAVGAVSRRCNVAVIVDERDPTAVRMQEVGGIRREVRRAVAWRFKWLSQRRGSLVGPLPWSGLCREWQKTVGLALPPD